MTGMAYSNLDAPDYGAEFASPEEFFDYFYPQEKVFRDGGINGSGGCGDFDSCLLSNLMFDPDTGLAQGLGAMEDCASPLFDADLFSPSPSPSDDIPTPFHDIPDLELPADANPSSASDALGIDSNHTGTRSTRSSLTPDLPIDPESVEEAHESLDAVSPHSCGGVAAGSSMASPPSFLPQTPPAISPVADSIYQECSHCEHYKSVAINALHSSQESQTALQPPTTPALTPWVPTDPSKDPPQVLCCAHVRVCVGGNKHLHEPNCVVQCRWAGCGQFYMGEAAMMRHLIRHRPKTHADCQWDGCNKKNLSPRSYKRHLGQVHAGYLKAPCPYEQCKTRKHNTLIRTDMLEKRHQICFQAAALLKSGHSSKDVETWYSNKAGQKEKVQEDDDAQEDADEGADEMKALPRPTKRSRADTEDYIPRPSKRARAAPEVPARRSARGTKQQGAAPAGPSVANPTTSTERRQRRH
ncbi:hypothetical protein OBBRIDRAFT_325635 [Obba rivulosa]|uniref:C2H2-type domain-containing protein n=1 Tax=Obba rivulosa TaxID=1052685 RepID=A0A8E2ATY1_9APHY|nr:hypothetical protein OBBRIDRAFT_325635 [Obba rivulosa]